MSRQADPFGAWFRLGMDMWLLGAEASNVIALRTMKVAVGGTAARDEMDRMVDEKVAAGVALSGQLMVGALGTSMPGIGSKAVAHYRRKVRANRRRLSR